MSSENRFDELLMSRRAFAAAASGAGLGAFALGSAVLPPFVSRSGAQDTGGPKRLVCIFTNNHQPGTAFTPTGSERDFALSTILRPLEPFQDKLIVYQGLSSSFDDHGGAKSLFSEADGQGPSIDQEVAKRLGNATRLRSLDLGVMTGGTSMFYAGPGLKVPLIEHPMAAYQRVVNAATADPATEALEASQSARVMSAVAQRYRTLSNRLTPAERRLVDAHITELADLERRVSSPAMARACEIPATPGVPTGRDSLANDEYFPDVCRAQLDILATAFACDVTRVAAVKIGHALTHCPWLGLSDNSHDVAHGFRNSDDSPLGSEGWVRIQTWHAEQVAYLATRLAAIPEGSGSVLDNTVIHWASELGLGQGESQGTHRRTNLPGVLVGSCGGYFDTGRYLDFGGRPNADLLLTLGHAMGFEDMDSFGIDSTGVLETLRA